MTSDPRLRVPLVLLMALLLQTTVIERIRIAGVIPDLMLLMAVAAGITAGAARGAAIGFAAGMLFDLFLRTPMGLGALVFTLVGYGVGVINTGVLRSAWYIPMLTSAGASVAGVLLWAGVELVLGEPILPVRLATIAAVVGVTNAVLAPVAVRVVRWSLAADDGRVPIAG